MKGKLSKKNLICIAAISAILLAAVIAVLVVFMDDFRNILPEDYKAIANENLFKKDGEYVKPELEIDGVLDDEQWKDLETREVTGAASAVVKAFYGKDGIYVGAEVSDTNICGKYDYVNVNSSFEFYLDTKGDGGSDVTSDNAWFTVDVNGDRMVREGRKGKWNDSDLLAVCATKIDGTLDDELDDKGYCVEMYIPYSEIGGKPQADYLAGFGVRKCGYGSWGTASRIGGMSHLVPDTFYTFCRETNSFLDAEKTNLSKAKIDGKDSDSIWKNRVKYTFINGGTVSAMFQKEGLYMFFEIKDDKAYAKGTNPTWNDGVEIYLDTKDNGGKKLKEDDAQVRVDLLGRIDFMTGTEDGWVVPKANIISASKLNGGQLNGTCESYHMEVFIPWSDLGVTKVPKKMGVNFGVNDWDGVTKPDGTREKRWEGIGANPQVPDTYIRLTNNFEKENYAKYKVDGKATDSIWKKRNSYTFVNGGKLSNYFAKEGIYFLFEMTDDKICAEGNTVTQNDSVGIYLDPKVNGGKKPQIDDVQINVDVNGNMRFLAGTGTGWKYVINDSLTGAQKTKDGYSLEVFVPWSDLGLDKVPEFMKAAFDHIDWDGELKEDGKHKTTYAGIGVDPQVPDQYMVITHNFAKEYLAKYNIDGKATDEIWKNRTKYDFVKGGTISNYFAEEGIYFLFEIKDDKICTEDSTVTKNDSVGIYLDPKSNGGTKPQKDDVQINVDASGSMRFLVGTGSGWKHALNDTFAAGQLVKNGYRIEVFIPWSDLGMDKMPQEMRASFDHVDCDGKVKWDGTHVTEWSGIGADPQIPNQYIRLTHKFEKINYAKYSVDGKAQDSIWSQTKEYAFSNGGTIRHYFAEEGIYFFFDIKDSLVCAEGKAAYLNDSVGIYLDTKMNGGTKPQTDDYQITTDVAGNMRFLVGTGSGWKYQDNDALSGVQIVDGKLNEKATGYCLEVFIPWADLGLKVAPEAMNVTYDNVHWNGVTKSDGKRRTNWFVYGTDPQSPDTYITIFNDN